MKKKTRINFRRTKLLAAVQAAVSLAQIFGITPEWFDFSG